MASINDTPLAQLLSTRSNITLKEIGWLAGLLEGEGCFGFPVYKANGERHYGLLVTVSMTDRDVVEKARRLMRAKRVRVKPQSAPRKIQYRASVNGAKAVAVMMTILPFMGERRSQRIKECIARWKSPRRFITRQTHCKYGHPFSADNTYVR